MEKRRMMLCYFLLLTSAASAISEKRLVCQESYVRLFENVTADNPAKDVSLYINGAEQPNLIVIFGFGNGAITAEWRMDNYTKIFMDGNRNIWIASIDKSYEGKYYIQSSGRREVELTISENKLTEEEIKNWLDDHPRFIEEYLRNLTDEVGKEISKWLEDHPGFFIKLFDSCNLGLIIVAIIIIVLVTVSHGEGQSELVADVFRMPKCSRCQNYNVKLLRCDQQQSLKVCCEPEHEIEESKTEHQPGINPQKYREIQELRAAAICKICFASKMSVCFMPCKHVATCAKCSIHLDACPVCRATIERKMNIHFE